MQPVQHNGTVGRVELYSQTGQAFRQSGGIMQLHEGNTAVDADAGPVVDGAGIGVGNAPHVERHVGDRGVRIARCQHLVQRDGLLADDEHVGSRGEQGVEDRLAGLRFDVGAHDGDPADRRWTALWCPRADGANGAHQYGGQREHGEHRKAAQRDGADGHHCERRGDEGNNDGQELDAATELAQREPRPGRSRRRDQHGDTPTPRSSQFVWRRARCDPSVMVDFDDIVQPRRSAPMRR